MAEKSVLINEDGEYDSTPTYLFDHAALYKTAPHDAGLTWFTEARYGLGVNFGLYSLLGRGHDAQVTMGIAVKDYENLMDNFKADHFDAMDLVEFAIANGMRYINFPARLADGFCLFNSKVSDFTCAKSPAQRDLLGELASVCEYHGIGLCLTYSHGLDWRHPHAPGSRAGTPDLDVVLSEYLDFMAEQIKELLTQYGPIAAICLEGIESAKALGHEKMGCADLYRLIRMLQPHVLLSYEQGLTGDEDFFAAENLVVPEDSKSVLKPSQINDSLTPGFWGYNADFAGKHVKEDAVWEKLLNAGRQHSNLLLNTNLMPDGSLDLEDINTLLAVGKRIEAKGFPR